MGCVLTFNMLQNNEKQKKSTNRRVFTPHFLSPLAHCRICTDMRIEGRYQCLVLFVADANISERKVKTRKTYISINAVFKLFLFF